MTDEIYIPRSDDLPCSDGDIDAIISGSGLPVVDSCEEGLPRCLQRIAAERYLDGHYQQRDTCDRWRCDCDKYGPNGGLFAYSPLRAVRRRQGAVFRIM
jgi:hypothetical protein